MLFCLIKIGTEVVEVILCPRNKNTLFLAPDSMLADLVLGVMSDLFSPPSFKQDMFIYTSCYMEIGKRKCKELLPVFISDGVNSCSSAVCWHCSKAAEAGATLSGLQTSSVLIVTTMWEVSPWMEDLLSLCFTFSL